MQASKDLCLYIPLTLWPREAASSTASGQNAKPGPVIYPVSHQSGSLLVASSLPEISTVPRPPRRPDGAAPPARKLSWKSDSIFRTMKLQWKQQLKQCCTNSPTERWGRASNLAWCLRAVELTVVRHWSHLLLSPWCSSHGQGLGNVAANLDTSRKDIISHVLASQNVSWYCDISPCESNFYPMKEEGPTEEISTRWQKSFW